MSAFTQLSCHQGRFDLKRLPHDASNTLRAWDSADELLLKRASDLTDSDSTVLILNDSFGALACAFSASNTISMGDSYVSRLAAQQNLSSNQLPSPRFLDSTDALVRCQYLLMKQTKNLHYFEYQLQQLASSQAAGTPLLIAGMQKYLSKGFIDIAAKYLDEFIVSRAEKKARVLSGNIIKHAAPVAPAARYLADYDITVFDTANVFASGKLDIGSRFLLQHFPELGENTSLIDLGCGNGILGLTALRQGAHVHFVDESWHALRAVELALQQQPGARAELHLSNCLQQYEGDAVDLVLCNPPFHQQQAVATHIAWQMFKDARQHLKPDGSLYVVANRHLDYYKSLKKLFSEVSSISSNNKFVVLKASSAS